MRRVALALLLAPAAASGYEISLQGGPLTLSAGDGAPMSSGVLGRLGIGAGRRDDERAELAFEMSRVSSVTSEWDLPVTRGWSALSVRYLCLLPSSTPARLLWTVGLDLGLASVRATDELGATGFFVGGHLGGGVRVPVVQDRLDFQGLLLGHVGAGAPGISTTLGLVAHLD